MGRLQRLRREAVRALYLVRSRLAGLRGGSGAGAEFWRGMWEEAAAATGAELVDLGDGFLEIGRNGTRTRVWKGFVEIDHPVTLQLSGNKTVVLRLLAEAGIPVPEHLAFDLGRIDAAADFARRLGRDCVVKPLRGSGGGVGVTTHVRTPRQVRRAAYEASIFGRELLIEEQVAGVGLAGVDAITVDPSVSLKESGGVVNEVNTTPGLQWHYRIANPEQGVKVAIPVLERIFRAKASR